MFVPVKRGHNPDGVNREGERWGERLGERERNGETERESSESRDIQYFNPPVTTGLLGGLGNHRIDVVLCCLTPLNVRKITFSEKGVL